MPTPKKEQMVQELEAKFKTATSLVFTEFRGTNANDMVELRKELRKNAIEYRVVKNRLALLAAKNAGITIDPEILKGPTGICFAAGELATPFKVSVALEKKYQQFKIKGGLAEGEMLDVNGAKELAKLPSREELLARLAGALQSPIQQLASVLSAIIRSGVVVLSEVAKVKPADQAQPEPPAAEEPKAEAASAGAEGQEATPAETPAEGEEAAKGGAESA